VGREEEKREREGDLRAKERGRCEGLVLGLQTTGQRNLGSGAWT
jgi:IS5 family transposase